MPRKPIEEEPIYLQLIIEIMAQKRPKDILHQYKLSKQNLSQKYRALQSYGLIERISRGKYSVIWENWAEQFYARYCSPLEDEFMPSKDHLITEGKHIISKLFQSIISNYTLQLIIRQKNHENIVQKLNTRANNTGEQPTIEFLEFFSKIPTALNEHFTLGNSAEQVFRIIIISAEKPPYASNDAWYFLQKKCQWRYLREVGFEPEEMLKVKDVSFLSK